MTILAVVAVYLAIGVLVMLSPPGRGEIAKQVLQVRGEPIANALTGRQAPPEWKVALFRASLAVGGALLWPFVISDLMRQWKREKREQQEWEERIAQGLEYSRTGGAGVISCERCGFREEIVSFMHGLTSGPDASAEEGRQCLQCGKFTTVHLEGNPPVNDIPRCACGGTLSRDHFLFCPKCRSRELKYRMTVIS